MKLKIFSPQRTFQTIQNSFLIQHRKETVAESLLLIQQRKETVAESLLLIQHRKEMAAESLLLATISYSEIRNYLVIFMLPT